MRYVGAVHMAGGAHSEYVLREVQLEGGASELQTRVLCFYQEPLRLPPGKIGSWSALLTLSSESGKIGSLMGPCLCVSHGFEIQSEAVTGTHCRKPS